MPGHPLIPPVRAGFFGKIPSRGDFVRARLSPSFVRAWDAWVRHVLPGSERILGEAWAAAWRAAAPWRFALPAGQCGARSVAGLWLPSEDRVGRPWPLVIAAEGAAGDDAFLDAAERLGRDALRLALSPDELAARLDGLPSLRPARAEAPAWWRAGGQGEASLASGCCLADAAAFAAMLRP